MNDDQALSAITKIIHEVSAWFPSPDCRLWNT